MDDITKNFQRNFKMMPGISKGYFVTKVMYYKIRSGGLKGPYSDMAHYYVENGVNKIALLKNKTWGIPAPNYDAISENETIILVSPKKGVWIPKKVKLNAKGEIDVVDEQVSMWRHMAETKGLAIYQPQQSKLMQVLPIITVVGLGLSLYFVAMGADIIFGGINSATYTVAAQEIKNSMGTLEDMVDIQTEELRILKILISGKGYDISPPVHPLDNSTGG